jgi:hypothetical protein
MERSILAMKMAAVLLAAFAAGCSASANLANSDRGADASGVKPTSDAGTIIAIGDAAINTPPVVGNLSDNPPTFDWPTHTCIGCTASGGQSASGGGASGFAGASGAGGAIAIGGSSGTAGAKGSGGTASSAGGAPGSGGSASSGAGGSKADASVLTMDAPTGPIDGGGFPREAGAGLRDGSTSADASAGAEDASSDGRRSDSAPACVARIVPVAPTSLDFLIAGAKTRIVLRAEIVSGGPATGVAWTWQGWVGSTPLPTSARGQDDPAEAAFAIANPGQYTFTAMDSTRACSVTLSPQPVVDPNDRGLHQFDWFVMVNATPPPTANVPDQLGFVDLVKTKPTVDIGLFPGELVQISPSVRNNIINSYVRISRFDPLSGQLQVIADGEEHAQASQGAGAAVFGTRLLTRDLIGSILRYNVLVVPLDGSGVGTDSEGTVAATAPQLFPDMTPTDINGTLFKLEGGATVTGTMLSAGGQPVVDARLVLTDQDPSLPPPDPSRELLFSSVGRSDAQGSFRLHVQPGTQYWLSVVPPPESGLAEALAPESIPVADNATLGFQWDAPTPATLTLTVVDAGGTPMVGTRVRATSAQARKVGTLSVHNPGSDLLTRPAFGHVQVEETTSSAGVAIFANLPADSTYDLLLVPASPGPRSTTTTRQALSVPAGGATQTVSLQAESKIVGSLLAPTAAPGVGPLDFSTVIVQAYDQSADSPEAPKTVTPTADGSFSLGVTPGRSYVVLAMPPTNSGAARTFVGPGPMQASEFAVTQKLMASVPWKGKVAVAGTAGGIPGTVLQIRCQASWPYCFDATLPLAETTADASGTFQFALPDPTSR